MRWKKINNKIMSNSIVLLFFFSKCTNFHNGTNVLKTSNCTKYNTIVLTFNLNIVKNVT